MANKVANQIRLGAFILAGLGFLILLLYMIGRNQDLFGKTFLVRARFENAQGLVPGNNIRFAGINAGTVKSVRVLNDTTVEVTMMLKTKMKSFIHKNSTVTIGTDGLMGNKLIHIDAVREWAPVIEENDILKGATSPDTDEMMKMLQGTTRDIAIIVSELKTTVKRINNSSALWQVLNDPEIPDYMRGALDHIRKSAVNVSRMTGELDQLVSYVNSGKGNLGRLIKDSAIMENLEIVVQNIRRMGAQVDSLACRIERTVSTIDKEINNGSGVAHALLKDEELLRTVQQSLENIEKGTAAFNENMEALKHSFLLKGYFRKHESQQIKKF